MYKMTQNDSRVWRRRGVENAEAKAASWFTPGKRTVGGDRFTLRKLEIPDHLTIE
jgi:hypothetical protein